MNLQQMKSVCALSVVSVALTGCVGGIFDEDRLESKNQSFVIQGVTEDPNQQVTVNCNKDGNSEAIAQFLSAGVPVTNAEGDSAYPFKRTIMIPEECWYTDGGTVNAEGTAEPDSPPAAPSGSPSPLPSGLLGGAFCA